MKLILIFIFSWAGIWQAEKPDASKKVFFQGQLMSPEEKSKKQLEREQAAAKSLGFEIVRGAWMTPEEKLARDRGFMLVDGKWIFPDSSKTRQVINEKPNGLSSAEAEKALNTRAEVVSKHLNLKLEYFDTFHFRLIGSFDPRTLQSISQSVETGWGAFQKLLHGDRGDLLASSDMNFHNGEGGRFEIYVLGDTTSYSRMVRYAAAQSGNETEEWQRERIERGHFHHNAPIGFVVCNAAGKQKAEISSELLHELGHLLINRYHYGQQTLPFWYEEAVACFVERLASGANLTTCVPVSGAADQKKLFREGGWKSLFAQASAQKTTRPIRMTVPLAAENFDLSDFLLSMAIVDFLSKESALKNFHDALLSRSPKFGLGFRSREESVAAHELAFQAALGKNSEAVEKALRSAGENKK